MSELNLDFVKEYEKKQKKNRKNKYKLINIEHEYRTNAEMREKANRLIIEQRLITSAKKSILWSLEGLTPYQKKRALLDAQHEISQS